MNLRQLGTSVKKLSSTNKHGIAIVALLLIAIATHWRWFYEPNSILTYGDWWFFYPEKLHEFYSSAKILTADGFGGINLGLSQFPVTFLLGFIGQWLSSSVAMRILFLWPSLLLAVIGSYCLGWKITQSRLAAFLQSIIYTYSVYMILLRTGNIPLATSFALSPIILTFLLDILQKPTIRGMTSFILVNFIAGVYEIRALYLTTFCVGIVLLVILIRDILIVSHHKRIFRYFVCICTSYILLLVLNLYWIVPFSQVNYLSTTNPLFQRSLFGTSYVSTLRSLALFHPFWSAGQPVPFIVQPIPLQFFILPILAFIPLSRRVLRRDYYFAFTVITLMGLFLIKMDNPPFVNIYSWLFINFPGFAAFRESSKFYFLTTLGYSVLISNNVFAITEFLRMRRYKWYFYCLPALVTLIIFIYNTTPLISGIIGTIFISQTVPQQYKQVNNTLSEDKNYSRVLALPYTSRWITTSSNKPLMSYYDLIAFIGQNSYLLESSSLISTKLDEKHMDELLNDKLILDFLAKWSFKYFIVPINHAESGEVNFNDRERIIKILLSNKHFRVVQTDINKSEEVVVLFELIDPAPIKAKLISGFPVVQGVNLDSLILSTRYHPKWALIRSGAVVMEGVRDKYGRQTFQNAGSNAQGLVPIFIPQTALDVYSKISFSALLLIVIASLISHLVRPLRSPDSE